MNPEGKIQSDIIHALYDNKYIAFYPEFRGQRGCPDIIVFREGYAEVAWLEVKTETGELSEWQLTIHKVLRSCGQAVATVRTVDEALEFVHGVFYG